MGLANRSPHSQALEVYCAMDLEKLVDKDQVNTTKFMIWIFTPIKIAIAFALMWFWEFGIYAVVAYLIWSLEHTSAYQHLNTKETDQALRKINTRIPELQDESNS